MALPLTREETAAPGALAKSDTFNAIQDAIVGLHNRVRGANTRIIAPAEMQGHNAQWTFVVPALGLTPHWLFHGTPTASPGVWAPIPCLVGARVTGARVFVYQDTAAAAAIGAVLIREEHATSGIVVGTVTAQSDGVDTIAATGYQVIELTGIVPTVIASGESWQIKVSAQAAGVDLMVRGAEVDFDHPL